MTGVGPGAEGFAGISSARSAGSASRMQGQLESKAMADSQVFQCRKCSADMDEVKNVIRWRRGEPYCEFCDDELNDISVDAT